MLRAHGHHCETAAAVASSDTPDDSVTVWVADHSEILVSTDVEFAQRRHGVSVRSGWT
jgi:hypothetical protein